MKLTAEQFEQYEDEGYVIVRDVFDPEQDIDPSYRRVQRCVGQSGARPV